MTIVTLTQALIAVWSDLPGIRPVTWYGYDTGFWADGDTCIYGFSIS